MPPRNMNHESTSPEHELLHDLTALRLAFAQNVKAMLGSALAGVGLAPRDEFLTQTRLLSRLTDRVEVLEQRVTALEQAEP